MSVEQHPGRYPASFGGIGIGACAGEGCDYVGWVAYGLCADCSIRSFFGPILEAAAAPEAEGA